MMESLLRNKSALQDMAKGGNCHVWMTKRLSGEKRISTGLMMDTITDEGFWKKAEEVKALLEPMMLTLRRFDTYEARTGDVVNVMRDLRCELEEVKLDSLFESSFAEVARGAETSEARALQARAEIMAIFTRRWEQFESFSHVAGFLLNPSTVINRAELEDEVTAASDAFYEFMKATRPMDECLFMVGLMNKWLNSQGPLNLDDTNEVFAAKTLAPYKFWDCVGGQGTRGLPELREFAIRILTQVL